MPSYGGQPGLDADKLLAMQKGFHAVDGVNLCRRASFKALLSLTTCSKRQALRRGQFVLGVVAFLRWPWTELDGFHYVGALRLGLRRGPTGRVASIGLRVGRDPLWVWVSLRPGVLQLLRPGAGDYVRAASLAGVFSFSLLLCEVRGIWAVVHNNPSRRRPRRPARNGPQINRCGVTPVSWDFQGLNHPAQR